MSTWKYDEDTGHVMCRCPKCSGRLMIGLYVYRNPYQYCPYCGSFLEEGNITAKRKEVYSLEQEDQGQIATIETRWEFAR